jgi:hypothetical protein
MSDSQLSAECTLVTNCVLLNAVLSDSKRHSPGW